MKESYENASVDVIEFVSTDIILTSGECDVFNPDQNETELGA